MLIALVAVVTLRLSWTRTTATEGEYRRLAVAVDAATSPAGADASGLYGHAVAALAGGQVGVPRAATPEGVPGLVAGRNLSRVAGLMGLGAGAAWLAAVASRGRRGRFGGWITGVAAPGPGEPGAVRAPWLAATLALLAPGLCLPLVHHGALLGPGAAATAVLWVAAALAWHAVAGGSVRRWPRLSLAAAAGAAAVAWSISPRIAWGVAGLVLWTLVVGWLRLRADPDPQRRFRNATAAALIGLLLLSVLVGSHYAGVTDPPTGGVAALPLGGPNARVAAAGLPGLLIERLGWLAAAAPLALAVCVWARPAAGCLLVVLAGASLLTRVRLVDGSEADLLGFFHAVLLAWALAAAVLLPRVARPVAGVFQAMSERLGLYRHAPAIGRGLAALAVSLLVAWAAYRSPGYYLTAAVMHHGGERGPYGRTDWSRAADRLAAELRPGDAVATSSPEAARFHLGRADAVLSWSRLARAVADAAGSASQTPAALPREGRDGGFAVTDPSAGVPVVASVEGVRSLFRERTAGLLVVERAVWRDRRGVPDAVADEIERRASRVPLPVRSGLFAFRWGPTPARPGPAAAPGRFEPPAVEALAEARDPEAPMGRYPRAATPADPLPPRSR